MIDILHNPKHGGWLILMMTDEKSKNDDFDRDARRRKRVDA